MDIAYDVTARINIMRDSRDIATKDLVLSLGCTKHLFVTLQLVTLSLKVLP